MKRKILMRNMVAALATSCLAIVMLMSCGGDGTEDTGIATDPRPVVILAIDGLRADALGCYGALAKTPAFDALAA